MKKLTMVIVASVLVAAVSGIADTVTSVNVVGVMNTTILDGEWALLALPLEDIDGSGVITMSDILPTAPNATTVWVYQGGAWVKSESYSSLLGAWNPGTAEYIRSDALFINAPSGNGDIEISITGEVPGAYAPTSTVVVADGWTLMGYAYPADIALTNSTLSVEASNGDAIWYYESSAWSKLASYSSLLGAWNPSDAILTAGVGYFYQSTGGGFDWTEPKPYDVP